jgi:flagellar biogenesis protein FliO
MSAMSVRCVITAFAQPHPDFYGPGLRFSFSLGANHGVPQAVISYASYLTETLLTLVVVSGVAFAVLYGARRMGIGRPSGPVRLVGHLPLDSRRSVYLVRIASKVIVLGVAEGGMTKLAELEASDLPTQEDSKGDFSSVLARVLYARKSKAKDVTGAPS